MTAACTRTHLSTLFTPLTATFPPRPSPSFHGYPRFGRYFTNNNLAFDVIPFSTSGGSDYFPFVRAGKVAGSIATGAGGIKTPDQRERMGGIANTMFDSCCEGTHEMDCRTSLVFWSTLCSDAPKCCALLERTFAASILSLPDVLNTGASANPNPRLARTARIDLFFFFFFAFFGL